MNPHRPHRGEIVLIEAEPDRPASRGIYLTLGGLSGPHSRGVIRGLLCSNLVDMATSSDLVMNGRRTGTGFDLLAQGELYGYFRTSQVLHHLGSMERPMRLDRLPNLLIDDNGDGLPLAGPLDPRWKFKHDELYRMYETSLNPFDLIDW